MFWSDPTISNRKFTTLVVDNDQFIQILHKAILKSLGVETQFVGSGIDALDLFVSGANFDIIVIAWVLLMINGVEVN